MPISNLLLDKSGCLVLLTLFYLYFQVNFECDSYGVYTQRVVFAFNRSVCLFRWLKVTAQPEVIFNRPEDLALTESRRWESRSDVTVVRCPRT